MPSGFGFVQTGAARDWKYSFCAGRGHCRTVASGHESQSIGIDRIHSSIWSGHAERRRSRELHQSASVTRREDVPMRL
jgi:hypothetical protein